MSTLVGSWPGHRNARLGPFEYNGNIYVVIRSTSSFSVQKSSDGGSSFTEIVIQRLGNAATFDSVLGGSSLYIVGTETSTFTTIVFEVDLITEQIISQSGDLGRIYENTSGQIPLALAVRSNGNYVVFHQGPTEKIMGTDYRRVAYSIWDGNSWTTTVLGPVVAVNDTYHNDMRGGIGGTNDRAHAFVTQELPSNSGTRSLTVLSDNSHLLKYTSESSPAGLNYMQGAPDIYQGEISVPIIHVDDNGYHRVKFLSADDPAFSSELISGTTPETFSSNPGAFVYDNNAVLHALLVRDDNVDIEYTNDQGTGTWTVPELFATAGVRGISAGLIDGGNAIGVLYDDNGTVTFDKLTLAEPEPETPQGQFDLTESSIVNWQGYRASAGEADIVEASLAEWQGYSPRQGQFGTTETSTVTWAASSPTLGEFNLTQTSLVEWQGYRTSETTFDVVSNAIVAWVPAVDSSGEFNLYSDTLVQWAGEAFAGGKFDFHNYDTVGWEGLATASTTLDVTDSTVVEWEGYVTATTDLSLSDTSTITWVGNTTVVPAVGQFDLIESSTVSWDGSVTSIGQFDLTNSSTTEWIGSTTNTGQFDLTDSSVVTWAGSITSTGQFDLIESSFATWHGAIDGAGQFDLTDSSIATWSSAAISTGQFDLTESSFVDWIGSVTSTGLFDLTESSTITWVGEALVIEATGQFDLTESSTTAWAGSITSTGLFDLTESSTIAWVAAYSIWRDIAIDIGDIGLADPLLMGEAVTKTISVDRTYIDYTINEIESTDNIVVEEISINTDLIGNTFYESSLEAQEVETYVIIDELLV